MPQWQAVVAGVLPAQLTYLLVRTKYWRTFCKGVKLLIELSSSFCCGADLCVNGGVCFVVWSGTCGKRGACVHPCDNHLRATEFPCSAR